jgi:hypothetical protein
MEDIRFERQFRTLYSEGYFIHSGEERLGRVDLHYASEIVYGTLIVEKETSEDDVNDLIEVIDEELVMTADVVREDFQVVVYQGKELGFYSDDYFEDDDEDADDEDDDEDDGPKSGKKP